MRWFHQFANRIEYDRELPVVLALERDDSSGESLRLHRTLPESDERPHDRDVDLNGPRASQDAREHRHPMFGECVRPVTTSAMPTT